MKETTIGKLLVNEALPAELQDKYPVLDGKNINKLMYELAQKYPDQYREIAQKLMTIAKDAMYTSGGYSPGLKHLLPSKVYLKIKEGIDSFIQGVVSDNSKSQKEKDDLIVKHLAEVGPKIQKAVYDEALAEGNPLALQILSGAKGKPNNLQSLIAGDLLYLDQKEAPIPLPVLSGYGAGLTPAEYWAGSYGARKGVVDLKLSTADAGFFGKQLNQATHRLLVTAKDEDKYDPAVVKGFPVDIDDEDNEGALLAQDAGPYKRNTILTPKVLNHLKSEGIKDLLVRSPIVGGPPDGGVYANDVGVRERGGIAPIGDFVGITAASAVAEPVAQSQISAKHSGGVAGAGVGVSGFKAIDQLVQIPKVFPGGATHAQVDGKVSGIEDAPGGGKFVIVNNEQHYVPVGANITVKVGDDVEAGDPVSDGLPNPAELVKHKGIGEGRRQFIKIFKQTAANSGFGLNRRNLELVARGLINHVKMNEEYDEFLPDEVVPYSVLEHRYTPRDGHKLVDPRQALGKYLERPVLHHTIGTKVRPSMLKELQKYNVKQLAVHDDPPPYSFQMVRGMYNLSYDRDWMTNMLGSGLTKSLLDSTHHGSVSDESGTSYVPSLARGIDFNKKAPIKGFDMNDLRKSQAEYKNQLGIKTGGAFDGQEMAKVPSAPTNQSNIAPNTQSGQQTNPLVNTSNPSQPKPNTPQTGFNLPNFGNIAHQGYSAVSKGLNASLPTINSANKAIDFVNSTADTVGKAVNPYIRPVIDYQTASGNVGNYSILSANRWEAAQRASNAYEAAKKNPILKLLLPQGYDTTSSTVQSMAPYAIPALKQLNEFASNPQNFSYLFSMPGVGSILSALGGIGGIPAILYLKGLLSGDMSNWRGLTGNKLGSYQKKEDLIDKFVKLSRNNQER